MALPKRLILRSSLYALDGGTTILDATDEAGRRHAIMLVQHAFPNAHGTPDEIPGRLYFDRRLVPMRSDLERGLMDLLRRAEVLYSDAAATGERIEMSPNAVILGDDIRQMRTRSLDENIRALIAQIVGFVESEEYLRFAERME